MSTCALAGWTFSSNNLFAKPLVAIKSLFVLTPFLISPVYKPGNLMFLKLRGVRNGIT